jgi:hypothetical protein
MELATVPIRQLADYTVFCDTAVATMIPSSIEAECSHTPLLTIVDEGMQKRVFGSKLIFDCKFCKRVFRTGQALGGHISRVHGGGTATAPVPSQKSLVHTSGPTNPVFDNWTTGIIIRTKGSDSD